jgi:hypothetical protein
MLKRINRMQLAALKNNADSWIDLLKAEVVAEDRIDSLSAKRIQLRLGNGFVDLLEPDGEGPVADAVASRGAHLFSSGASTDDFDGLMAHLKSKGVAPVLENGCAYLDNEQTGGFGMRLVITPEENLPPTGALDYFYEASYLVDDSDATVAHVTDLFALDPANFFEIKSTRFKYRGWLTLFAKDQLGRFEIITPNGMETTMDRFYMRHGQCLYMCYGETGELAEIEQRVEAAGTGHTTQRLDGQTNPDVVFIHHTSLGGTMLGLSRQTKAWFWSGQPDRVEEVE